MVKSVCIAPSQAANVWPIVSHWIMDAYENPSDETFEQTEREVLDGHALLWIAIDGITPKAAAVSKVWKLGSRKLCTVLAVGGQSDDWPALLRPIEQYAACEGCDVVRLEGRKGWARVFTDYHQPWIVLEKKVS